jgi:hypothetical protein
MTETQKKTEAKPGTIALIAYSRFIPPKETADYILAMYSTTDDNAFSGTTGVQRNGIRAFEGPHKHVTAVLRQKGIEVRVQPPYQKLIAVKTEKELEQMAEPALYTGTYREPSEACEAISMTVGEYFTRVWMAQTSNERKFDSYNGKELRDFLYTNFAIPLSIAYRAKHQNAAHELRTDLMVFSYGSKWQNAAAKMANSIAKSQKYSDDLINAHVDMLVAINCENYELAGQLRDKIKEIEAKNGR